MEGQINSTNRWIECFKARELLKSYFERTSLLLDFNTRKRDLKYEKNKQTKRSPIWSPDVYPIDKVLEPRDEVLRTDEIANAWIERRRKQDTFLKGLDTMEDWPGWLAASLKINLELPRNIEQFNAWRRYVMTGSASPPYMECLPFPLMALGGQSTSWWGLAKKTIWNTYVLLVTNIFAVLEKGQETSW